MIVATANEATSRRLRVACACSCASVNASMIIVMTETMRAKSGNGQTCGTCGTRIGNVDIVLLSFAGIWLKCSEAAPNLPREPFALGNCQTRGTHPVPLCWPSQKGVFARLREDFEAALAVDRFSESEPARTVGIAWRRISLAKKDLSGSVKSSRRRLGSRSASRVQPNKI